VSCAGGEGGVDGDDATWSVDIMDGVVSLFSDVWSRCPLPLSRLRRRWPRWPAWTAAGTDFRPVPLHWTRQRLRCLHWKRTGSRVRLLRSPAYVALAIAKTVIFYFFTARSELRKVLFLAPSVCFFFVCEISREPLNGFASNSQGQRVWSLARTNLKVKVGQRSRLLGTKTAFLALSTVCVRFMFGKASLASSLFLFVTDFLMSLNRFSPDFATQRGIFW